MENNIMNLQSHIEYENSLDFKFLSDTEFRNKSKNHRNFLKQPLKLEMFVCCDEEGNVLNYNEIKSNVQQGTDNWNEWENAREKVLFEGFTVCDRDETIECIVFNDEHFFLKWLENKTIEYFVDKGITLTPNAIKQFNL